MAGINSRNKGANFERKIAKLLSEWWGSTFRRTPCSGGFDRSRFSGDIIADDDFPFSCELKCYKTISWMAVLSSSSCDLASFIKQAKSDAATGRKVAMLILKENGKAEVVGIASSAYDHLIEGPRFTLRDSDGDYWIFFPLKTLLSVPKEVWLE